MEKSALEVYKELDVETNKKVEAEKERTATRLIEIAEEHQEAMEKFTKDLLDEEFAELMKSEGLSILDKSIIMAAYSASHQKQ